ncbi:MAG: hypothetical protein WA162_08065 [Thermodesulfobacteriota bacterium]
MIVFDSSTLILLAKAELLDEFINDYGGMILIPQEVERECCRQKKTFDAVLIQKRVEDKKIIVAKISNAGLRGRLMGDFNICAGEAEAIVLAIERKAKITATDDRNAIKACKMLKMSFTSAIAILVRMKDKGTIDAERAKASLNALIKYGRYGGGIIKVAKARLKIG